MNDERLADIITALVFWTGSVAFAVYFLPKWVDDDDIWKVIVVMMIFSVFFEVGTKAWRKELRK